MEDDETDEGRLDDDAVVRGRSTGTSPWGLLVVVVVVVVEGEDELA